jgi:hypothetical protein
MADPNWEFGAAGNVDGGGLNDIIIEIEGRNALDVAAALQLGGLATKHTARKSFSGRDSAIMENALKKLRNR